MDNLNCGAYSGPSSSAQPQSSSRQRCKPDDSVPTHVVREGARLTFLRREAVLVSTNLHHAKELISYRFDDPQMDTTLSSATANGVRDRRNRIRIRIDNYKHAQDHVKYCIIVSINDIEHKVYRRYKEFSKYHSYLKETLRNLKRVKGSGNAGGSSSDKSPPKFPGKKMFANFDPHFLELRRGKLESFLTGIVANPIFIRLMCTLDFLQIPTSLVFSSEVTSVQGSKQSSPNVSKVEEFLSHTDLASVNYLQPSENNTTLQNFQDLMQCKNNYLLQGVSDIVCLLGDEPWWENSFRIFQHHCGAGIFATQLLYLFALKASNNNISTVRDTIKGLGMSIVGIDDNEDAITNFKDNIQRLSMASKAKAILHHGDQLGADFSGVYDVFLSIFSLRHIFTAASSFEMIESYFKNIQRTLKGLGYVIICEIADLVYIETPQENGDKIITAWPTIITKVCTNLSITVIREHKLFVRKPISQNNDAKHISNSISVPCVVLVARMPQKRKRTKRDRKARSE